MLEQPFCVLMVMPLNQRKINLLKPSLIKASS